MEEKIINVQDVNKIDEQFNELTSSLTKIVNIADYKNLRDNLLLLSDKNNNSIEVNNEVLQALIKIREMLDEHAKLVMSTILKISTLGEPGKLSGIEAAADYNTVVHKTDQIYRDGNHVGEISYVEIDLSQYFDKSREEAAKIVSMLGLGSFISLDISSYVLMNNIKDAKNLLYIESVWIEPEYRGNHYGIDAVQKLIEDNSNALIYAATFASREDYPTLDVDNGGENTDEFNNAVREISRKLADKFTEYGFKDINPYMDIYDTKVPMMYVNNEIGNKVYNMIIRDEEIENNEN